MSKISYPLKLMEECLEDVSRRGKCGPLLADEGQVHPALGRTDAWEPLRMLQGAHQGGGLMMKTKEQLEAIAEKALGGMPHDLTPSELGYVLSLMMKGHALALKGRGL